MKSCTVTIDRWGLGFSVHDDGDRFTEHRTGPYCGSLDHARMEQIRRVRYYEALGYQVRIVDTTNEVQP